jgi:hypothetical protein
MRDDLATFGVVAVILVLATVFLGLRRADGLFLASARLLKRPAIGISLLVAVLGLLVLGISRTGLVKSEPNEQHVEYNRENSRLILSEDKDGCMDMRTLGRSNGVYLSVKPCKPKDNKDEPDK